MNNFVPLHIVSCYSFLQSGLTIERIKASVFKNEYFGMGLCDNGVMFGVPSFVKASEEIKRPYIIGMEVAINDDYLCLYAINEEGYHHLMEISTAIQKEQLNFELIKQKADGLIAVIETHRGKFNELFVNQDASFNRYLYSFSEVFKDGFFLGLDIICKEDVNYANKIRAFAKEHAYDCLAFPTILYQKKDDAIVLKIVEAIANGDTLEEEEKMDGQQYFMPFSYYQKIYRPEEINNTQKILCASSFDFHSKRGEMLHFPVSNSASTLKELCFNRLKELKLDNDELYVNRLNYELETIVSLGYADYFLIVQDYVSFAKNNGILVGVGRGSASGSLVSYLLNITQINPLEYGLQFERFLNPFRKTMPDIDVDFMDVRRDEVIEYMREKYGNDHVANIVTFSTIQAKQSLRDIGRVYGFATTQIDLLSKRISQDVTLREAYKTLPEFRKLVDSDKYYLRIVTLASKIEGLIRQNGMHAAGIILNNSPLENALPVMVDFSNHYISQYEMGCLEEQGFLKMDFLGLRNLTTISLCVDLINKHHPDAHFDKQNLPFDDSKVYSLISSGQTLGLFQIETMAMRKAIKVLKPNCFEDVVALLALNRPGPKAFIPTYAKRKGGKEKVIFDDPSLEPILSSTYGILIYQEQINQIAISFANYTMGEADMFRRVVSKKNKEEMANNRSSFIKRAIENGHDEKTAAKVFSLIERFADYGFNKSHSVAYSMIACMMAYLKVYYPLEFYAAIFETSSSTDENDIKFNEYLSEMKKRNIRIINPDINLSSHTFIVKDDALLLPLSSIKGINTLFVNKILEEREEGPFKDFFDFVARMYHHKINEAQINALINAGCFDAFNPSRASFRASILNALQYAELIHQEDGQLDIGFSEYVKPYLIEEKDDPIDNLEKEYEVLGMMLSTNPLHYKADILKDKNITTILEAKEMNTAKIAGLVRIVKKHTTKKGFNMAYVTLMDETDEIEIKVFPKLYDTKGALLKKNSIIIAEIKKEEGEDSAGFICDDISPLEE